MPDYLKVRWRKIKVMSGDSEGILQYLFFRHTALTSTDFDVTDFW